MRQETEVVGSKDQPSKSISDRKNRVLRQGQHSPVSSVADAVTVKDANLIFLSKPDGSVPIHERHGYGIYYNDCRFLRGYEIRLCGEGLTQLASESRIDKALFELTNPIIHLGKSDELNQQTIGCRIERTLNHEELKITERIVFTYFGTETVNLEVEFCFAAEFEDIFVIRGIVPNDRGQLHQPAWSGDELLFAYDGSDEMLRRLRVRIDPAPKTKQDHGARLDVRLKPGQPCELRVEMRIEEILRDGRRATKRERANWNPSFAATETNHGILNRALRRSFSDLQLLTSRIGDNHYLAAGIPWYATLFGRDSIISALQTLPFDPTIARETLRVLAHYQGTTEDKTKDEEPGKISHELRLGEVARSGEVPYTPYYGTIDATPLYLVLMGEYIKWTNDLALFKELRKNVDAALAWMDRFGDRGGQDYLRYSGRGENHQLANQGWKDSGDAIVNRDGSLARPPIALVEVQGYAYRAKLQIADVLDAIGERKRAGQLRAEAKRLRERINKDFWLEDEGCFALALQEGDRPTRVISSNAGQLLWSGAADTEKAKRTVERLMREDCFPGWGIRTLSAKEKRYNPVGYHLGTIWPHDNSLIAAGFRNYGEHGAANRVFQGIMLAASRSGHFRLPEVFSGFSKDQFRRPVSYPVACHPQAWAAGAVPYLLWSSLGLTPDARASRLSVGEIESPKFLKRVKIENLRVGKSRVDLLFERKGERLIPRVLKGDVRLD